MLRAVFAATAAALAVPVSAQAALSFAFARTQARPGQLVHAYQADSDGNPAPAWDQLDGVMLYLVRLNNASAKRVPLGPMGTDDQGVWSVTFHLPKVRPGLYTIAFLCGPCDDTYFLSTEPGTPWTPRPGRVLKVRR